MDDHKGSTSTGAVTTGVSAKPTIGHYARWYFELTRLHKFPLGNILIIWPCLWGLTMAAYNTKLPFTQLATQSLVFALGSTSLHSTACVINDICDIEFDRRVERTKSRPLASGLLPVSGAWVLWGVGVAGCFALLTMTNRTAATMGVFDLFPLHALYPLMKRWTYWPQAWLGIAMNWGFMVAWLHAKPVNTPTDWYVMITMLLGATCWTIVYDTQYACQDRADDAKLGIKSTALLFGENVRPILIGFATVFVLSLVAAGILNGQSAIYYVVSCGGAAAHLTWQFTTWDVNDVEDCGRKFKSNGDIGYVIWIGMLLEYYLRT